MKLHEGKARHLLLPLAGALVWACADPSTAPVGSTNNLASGPKASVVGVPDPTGQFEGLIMLCKATETVGAPAATFTFNVSVDGAPTNPTVDVGACIEIVNDQVNEHTATISEQALENWTLDSIRVEARAACVSRASENGTTATAYSSEDCWTRVTFWNSWEEPDVPEGCTLTQGYWKTHSDNGPAPFDDTWDLLPSGSATTFYLSGQSWYQVFHTPPAGNAYYNLAHQYMAAVLNGLAGADQSAISTQLGTAHTLFNTYTPAQIGVLKGSNALRQQFISLAGALGAYNEGITGPGHCEEEE